jgi:hypothetical protein
VKGTPEYAALLLQKGDRAVYDRLRARVLAQLARGPNLPDLRALLWAGSLAPCSPTEAAGLLAAASRLREACPADLEASDHAAVAHYRAAEWAPAVQCLEEIGNVQRGDAFAARTEVLRGLLALRQGKTAAAKGLFARTDEWREREAQKFPPAMGIVPVGWDWVTWLEVRSLRREAELLLPDTGPG